MDSSQFQTVAKASPKKKDIVGLLPVEINVVIAKHLGRYDIVVCLGVSRQWRMKFRSKVLMHSAIERFFPSLVPSKGSADQDTTADYYPIFNYGIRRGFNRDNGTHSGMLAKTYAWKDERLFDLDTKFHLSGGDGSDDAYVPSQFLSTGVGQTAVYACGHLGWMPFLNIVVVDNLRTKKRRIFTPNTLGLQLLAYDPLNRLAALGDELAVISTGFQLIAWKYKTDEVRVADILRPVNRCVTEGERVVATHADKFIIWSFNGSPRSVTIDISEELRSSWIKWVLTPSHDVILHPHKSDVWFIATACQCRIQGIPSVAFEVHEYKDDLCVQRYSFIHPGSTDESLQFDEMGGQSKVCPVRAQKADEFGTFSLSVVFNETLHDRCYGQHDNGYTWPADIVLFNIINCKFSFRRFMLPQLCLSRHHHALDFYPPPMRLAIQLTGSRRLARFLLQHQLWNDTVICQDPLSLSQGYSKLVAVPTQENVWRGTSVPQGTGANPKPIPSPRAAVSKTENTTAEFPYELPIPGELDDSNYDRPGDFFETCHGSYGRNVYMDIKGDNDFVVLIEEDRFTVWSFHSDFHKAEDQDPPVRYPLDLWRARQVRALWGRF